MAAPPRLSAAQQRYVQSNYGDLLDSNHVLTVSTPAGNGGEPVLTFQTADLVDRLQADPRSTFHVQTHYHGDILADNPIYSDRETIVDAMKRLWSRDASMVFVLPQTKAFGAASGDDDVGTQLGYKDWNNVSDQVDTVRTALTAAGLDPNRVSDQTVSGHSSGGFPVAHVMAATVDDPSAPKMAANRVLLLDTVRGELRDPAIPQWWHQHYPSTVTYVDAAMHSWTRDQAESYGWDFQMANDHFDAVKRFFDYRADAGA